MDLTDQQWALLQPLLPPPSPSLRGRPPIDERAILNGVLWKLRTNSPWYDMPAYYPSHQTCYRRYRQWRKLGLLSSILRTLFLDLHHRGGLDLASALDNGSITIERRDRRLEVSVDPQLENTWQLSTAMIFLWMALKRFKSS
jgi:transposase